MIELSSTPRTHSDIRSFLNGRTLDGQYGCPFCLEVNDPSYALSFLGEEWPFPDRLLSHHEGAISVAGYGPQVFPYALVVPRRHIHSFAETTSSERESVFECLDSLIKSRVFPSDTLTVFEHGDCPGRLEHSCVDHCHLHVVDGCIPMSKWLVDAVRRTEPARSSVDELWSSTSAYLFAGTYRAQGRLEGVLSVDHPAERQFFRRVLADRLQLGPWDWRAGMNWDYMRRIVEAMRRH